MEAVFDAQGQGLKSQMLSGHGKKRADVFWLVEVKWELFLKKRGNKKGNTRQLGNYSSSQSVRQRHCVSPQSCGRARECGSSSIVPAFRGKGKWLINGRPARNYALHHKHVFHFFFFSTPAKSSVQSRHARKRSNLKATNPNSYHAIDETSRALLRPPRVQTRRRPFRVPDDPSPADLKALAETCHVHSSKYEPWSIFKKNSWSSPLGLDRVHGKH